MAKLLLIFSLLLLQFPILAQQPEELEKSFAKANELYRQQRYSEAIKEYEILLKSGVKTAALYGNLANAYFQKGDKGKAIWYFEKARYLNPLDQDIYRNQQAALNKNRTLEKAGFWELSSGIPVLMGIIRIGPYVGSMLLLIGSLGYLYTVAKSNGKTSGVNKQTAVKVGIIGGLVVLLCLTGFWLLRPSASKVVVLENTVGNIGPNALARKGVPLKAGEEAQIINSFKGWVKLSTRKGKETWVLEKGIGRITE